MFKVGIWLGPAFEDWNETDYINSTKKIAGSEAWGYEVAFNLSKLGYDVTLVAQPGQDRVVNLHLTIKDYRFYDVSQDEWDVFIVSRQIGYDISKTKAKKKIFVAHDIGFYHPDQIDNINYYDWIGYLSDYQRDVFITNFPVIAKNIHKMFKFSNGFSSEFYNVSALDINKKKFQTVWSSSIDRHFFEYYYSVMFPIIQRHKDFKVIVTYNVATDDEIARCKLLPNVEVYRGLSKAELAKTQCESMFWMYSGTFPETFCISAVENCAAGNFIVAPMSYGIRTTLEGLETGISPVGELNDVNAQQHIDLFEGHLAMSEEEKAKYRVKVIKIAFKYSWMRSAREIEEKFV